MVWAPVIHSMNPVSSKDGLLAIYIYPMGSHHRGTEEKTKAAENFLLFKFGHYAVGT